MAVFIRCGCLVGLVLSLLAYLSVQSAPEYPERVEVDQPAKQIPASSAGPLTPRPQATGAHLRPPRLVAFESEFNFGTIDVGARGSHEFTVRNEGSGTLSLEVAGTSCRCTLVDLADGDVPPGGECIVRLDWHAEKPSEWFRHGALIRTNDALLPVLSLTVTGKVRTFLSAAPEEVVFTDLVRGETRRRTITVYSDAWSEFKIVGVESTLPELTFSESPSSSTLPLPAGLAARDLELTLTARDERGPFGGTLNITVRPVSDAAAQTRVLALPVVGNVQGYFSFYGRIVDSRGFLDLGPLPAGGGAKETIYLQIRGAGDDVEVLGITCEPACVKATVRKVEPISAKRPRFAIEIEVPADTPAINCMGPNMGQVRLRTSHPQQAETRLPIEFCVVQ